MSNELAQRFSELVRRPPAQELKRREQMALDLFSDAYYTPYNITATSCSLAFPDSITFDQWSQVLTGLLSVGDAVQFHVADALSFGEDKFSCTYAQAIEMAGASEEAAGKYKQLQRVAPRNRKAKLSVDHHLAVAGLPEAGQVDVLAKAARDNFSVKATRQYAFMVKQLASSIVRQDAAQPPPILTEDVYIIDHVEVSVQSILTICLSYMTREDRARLRDLLDNDVRSFGTGEVWMDQDVPTRAVYDPQWELSIPDAENIKAEAPPCTDIVATPEHQDSPADVPDPMYSTRDKIYVILDVAGAAGRSIPELYGHLKGIPEKTIRGNVKRLADEGVIVDTGEKRLSTTSQHHQPPTVWRLPKHLPASTEPHAVTCIENSIEAEYTDAN